MSWKQTSSFHLVLLDVSDFEMILGMNWLAQYYASLDCREKVVIFKIPNNDEFRFRGDKSSIPPNLISAITARKMFRRRYRGYLTVVRSVEAETGAVKNVPVVCEFPDVFPEELPGLPPEREIEFCIDVVRGANSTSVPPYRMTLAKLKEINEQLK